MNYLDIIILLFGVFYSFLLLHLADNGMQFKLQLYFLVVVIIALACYGLFLKKSDFEYLNWGYLSLPIFIVILLNLLNLLSWKLNKREFRLKIRGSRNITKGNTNWTDKVFSFLLIISFFVWPFSIALILKK